MQKPSMGIQIRAATPDLLAAAVRKFMGAELGHTYLDSPGTLAFVAADPEVLGWCWAIGSQDAWICCLAACADTD